MRWLDSGEARARAWLGSDVGTRRLEVRCRPVGRAQEISAVLLNTAAFHAPVVSDIEAVRRLVRALTRHPPALIWGVSNALYVLAVALLDDGRTVKAGACWSGGNHPTRYRHAFEKASEEVASVENDGAGLVAHECVEARTLHVPAEGIVVEVARRRFMAAPGETGDAVITTLTTRPRCSSGIALAIARSRLTRAPVRARASAIRSRGGSHERRPGDHQRRTGYTRAGG
jgi:hypothetical protein